MAIFDNIKGLIQPPKDETDYSVFNIDPIIPLPKDETVYKVDIDFMGFEPLPETEPIDELDNKSPLLPKDLEGETLEDSAPELPMNEEIRVLDSNIPILPQSESNDYLEEEDVSLPSSEPIEPAESDTVISLDIPNDLIDPFLIEPLPLPEMDMPPIQSFGVEVPPFDSDIPVLESVGSFLEGNIIKRPEGDFNWGNTWFDQIYTGATQVFDFLGLPIPEGLTSLYQYTQKIENFIEDPSLLVNQAVNVGLGMLFPGKKDGAWDEQKGIMNLPENKVYEIIEGKYKETTYDQELITENVKNDQYLNGIVEDIGDVAFSFQGRKSVVGMSMRMNHLWDLKMKPYSHRGVCLVPKMGVAYSNAYKDTATTEVYRDRSKTPSQFDFEDSMPILSYDLDFKSLVNKEIELFAGSTIHVPEVIRRTSHMSMQILDDENKRWRRWFQRYLESMYDEGRNLVAPYKHCCMEITLYQYRSDWKVLSHKVFLAILKNYQVLSSGAGGGSGNADLIDVEWSIVGELKVHEDGTDQDGKTVSNYVNII